MDCYYYYDKSKYCGEHCDRFDALEELQTWAYENMPERCDYAPFQEIFPGDDMHALCDDTLPNSIAIIETVEDADAAGMKRPYFITCAGDCDYTAYQTKEEIDWFGLYQIWSDDGSYIITPRYYEPGEMTPETADNLGMYMLADYIREDLGIVEDADDDNYDPDDK